MEAQHSTADFAASSVEGLLDELADLVGELTPERRHELMETLMAKDISEALKLLISKDARTSYRLAADAGVKQQVIDRFMTGERDIRMATAAKLAKALSLELRPSKQK